MAERLGTPGWKWEPTASTNEAIAREKEAAIREKYRGKTRGVRIAMREYKESREANKERIDEIEGILEEENLTRAETNYYKRRLDAAIYNYDHFNKIYMEAKAEYDDLIDKMMDEIMEATGETSVATYLDYKADSEEDAESEDIEPEVAPARGGAGE
jgi:hypothetical protein